MGVAVRTEGNGTATSSASKDASRLLTRRRSLPSGRAVVGGFLIALAALGAFVAARGTGGGPSSHYVVAARDLVAGSTLTESDLRTSTVDLPDDIASRAFTDPAVLVGKVVTAPLAAGELVQASGVVGGDAADARFQLSVPVERARALDGMLVAGERIDVLATFGTGNDSVTNVVVRGAEVLRVDQGQRGGLSASGDTIVLLAVNTPADALAVTHAAQAGKITLVRATAAPADKGPDSYRVPAAKPA